MCGITGCFRFNDNSQISLETIKLMTNRLYHRGPDESGIYIDDDIGLGHTRLSIIDLTSGQQPMSTFDKRFWIVYNGEIFNYIELKKVLLNKGYKFRTTSDTEVLLYLYVEYGTSCLSKLNGQFSFAIWDTLEKILFLARDRVGIRPLYYANASGQFIFGSEIKAIIEHPHITPKIAPKHLSELFTFWTPLSPNTVFENILELSPGHFMEVKRDGIKINSYWKLEFPENGLHRPISFDDAIEEFNELLTDSVKIRLRSDVQVGAYLSGGIDSSATTEVINNLFPENLTTFSIGFSDKEYDESHFQKIAVDYLHTNHLELLCDSRDISDIFPTVIWHTENPLIRTAPAPMYLLSKHVRENDFKVVITGEGADEILAGYNIFKEMAIRRFWARDPKSSFRPLLLKKLYPYLSHIQNLNNNLLRFFYGYQLSEIDSPFYSHLLRWNNTSKIKRYFSDDFKSQIIEENPLEKLIESLPENFHRYSSLSKAQWLETNIFMSGYLLSSQGDRMAMANSVEGRYPFLDHRLIEFCSSLSPDFKLDGLNEKKLLKKMMVNRLPASIINRPKQAYRAPTGNNFLTFQQEYLKEILSESHIKKSSIFNYYLINELIKKLKSGKQISEVDNMALTGIISTELVHDQFISGNLSDIKEHSLKNTLIIKNN